MIKRRYKKLHESYLHAPKHAEDIYPAGPMSNGKGPLHFADFPEDGGYLDIIVCGSQEWYDNEYTGDEEDPEFPPVNDVWVRQASPDSPEEMYGLLDLSAGEAVAVGEELAHVYSEKGLDFMIRKMEELGFESGY